MTRAEAVTFVIPRQLPGLNEYVAACRTSPQVGARMKRQVETMIMQYARIQRLPSCDGLVHVAFAWHEPNRRRDVDNVAFAKKFILDALVTVGVLAGDGRKHVSGFSDSFHLDAREPRVVVTVERAVA